MWASKIKGKLVTKFNIFSASAIADEFNAMSDSEKRRRRETELFFDSHDDKVSDLVFLNKSEVCR